MNLLNKTTPWIASLLVAATSVFGEDKPSRQTQRKSYEQGQKLTKTQMMPAYNAPARVDVRSSWDIYSTASFIYWQLSQDNMEVAFVDSLSNTDYRTNSQIQGNLAQLDFKYKPGFKVGLGANLDQDDWDAYAEYTRIHTKNYASTNGEIAADGSLAPIFATGGHPFIVPTNAYNSASESWNSNLDFIDIDLGRSYYVGTQLTFRPFVGARGSFITQNNHYKYVNHSFSAVLSPVEVPGVMNIYNRIRSWGIGPRTGLDANWMVGKGVRFFGNAVADVLYTKYKIQNKTSFLATTTVGTVASGNELYYISRARELSLRAHVDLEMGFGWGSYFDNNNWHIDLSAAYGFQVFFDQNMLNTFSSDKLVGSVLRPTGNLYAQGLTATVRFDY